MCLFPCALGTFSVVSTLIWNACSHMECKESFQIVVLYNYAVLVSFLICSLVAAYMHLREAIGSTIVCEKDYINRHKL